MKAIDPTAENVVFLEKFVSLSGERLFMLSYACTHIILLLYKILTLLMAMWHLKCNLMPGWVSQPP